MQCPNCGSYSVDSDDLDFALCRTCGYNWTPSLEPDWNGEVYPRKASTPAPVWEPPRFRPIEPEEVDDPHQEDLFSDDDDERDEWDEDEGDEEDFDDWEDDDWADAADFWDDEDD